MRRQGARPVNELTRRSLLAAALPAAALVLSACGDHELVRHGPMMGANRGATSAADHNQADVMFSMMMIPHHAQAVEMSDLVPSRSQDPELTALARRIKAAQQPEIERMRGWLEDWGQQPMMDSDDVDRMGGMGGMGGMMSDADLAELEKATGAAFERRWLEMMIDHHEGAITMAKSVRAAGTHAGTRALAESIITSQRAEIATMRRMLAR